MIKAIFKFIKGIFKFLFKWTPLGCIVKLLMFGAIAYIVIRIIMA